MAHAPSYLARPGYDEPHRRRDSFEGVTGVRTYRRTYHRDDDCLDKNARHGETPSDEETDPVIGYLISLDKDSKTGRHVVCFNFVGWLGTLLESSPLIKPRTIYFTHDVGLRKKKELTLKVAPASEAPRRTSMQRCM